MSLNSLQELYNLALGSTASGKSKLNKNALSDDLTTNLRCLRYKSCSFKLRLGGSTALTQAKTVQQRYRLELNPSRVVEKVF